MNVTYDEYHKEFKRGKKTMMCFGCGEKTLKLVELNTRYMSGDLHVYKCTKCEYSVTTIL